MSAQGTPVTLTTLRYEVQVQDPDGRWHSKIVPISSASRAVAIGSCRRSVMNSKNSAQAQRVYDHQEHKKVVVCRYLDEPVHYEFFYE